MVNSLPYGPTPTPPHPIPSRYIQFYIIYPCYGAVTSQWWRPVKPIKRGFDEMLGWNFQASIYFIVLVCSLSSKSNPSSSTLRKLFMLENRYVVMYGKILFKESNCSVKNIIKKNCEYQFLWKLWIPIPNTIHNLHSIYERQALYSKIVDYRNLHTSVAG